MALFSSTQPSLRARLLPRFPAQVLAGNAMSITKSGGTYTFAVVNANVLSANGWSVDSNGNMHLNMTNLKNAANDGAAAALGVTVGQVYRNGSVLMVRVA